MATRAEVREGAAAGLDRLAATLEAQQTPWAARHAETTSEPTSPRRRRGRAGFGLIAPALVLGGLGIDLHKDEITPPATSITLTADQMGIQPAAVDGSHVVLRTRTRIEHASATTPTVTVLEATPVVADGTKADGTKKDAPKAEITAPEVDAAVKAGVYAWTSFEAKSDKKGKVRTIWGGYVKELKTKFKKKPTNAQVNVDSRMSVAVTEAAYGHNPKDELKKFKPNAMQPETKFLILTDQSQLVLAGLLRVDVDGLKKNKTVPEDVIAAIESVQKINQQAPETKKTKRKIQEQNIGATDQITAVLTKLGEAYKTNADLKKLMDDMFAKLADNELSKADMSKAATAFMQNQTVLAALA